MKKNFSGALCGGWLNRLKKNFYLQGLLLTLISFFLRTTNIGYRSYLSTKIGAAGLGLYQLIFSVFMLCITLSTSGISLAVTRIVAQNAACGKSCRIRSAVFRCLLYCLSISCGIAVVFLFLAQPLARTFLGNEQAAPCLRILALGLPCMAVCTCLKGYFLAVEESLYTAGGDVLEQIFTIGLTVVLFWLAAPQSLELACALMMVSSSFGELCGFLFCWVCFRRSLKRNTPTNKEPCPGIVKSMCHIALPCTLSSAARSLLVTAENLLIPLGLKRNGSSYEQAMAQYGQLSGMAFPMLLFPSAFLTAFSSLLIPKAAMAYAKKDTAAICRITQKAMSATLVFSCCITALFAAFYKDWGSVFYHSEDAGAFLLLLCPLVPLLYLDGVVDALLKGLDQQLHSFAYNIADSSMRVLLVYLLLPKLGIRAYIAVIFFSTVFNASLSIHRLIYVTQIRPRFTDDLLLPGLCAAVAVLTVRVVFVFMPDLSSLGGFCIKLLLACSLYLLLLAACQRLPAPGSFLPRQNTAR